MTTKKATKKPAAKRAGRRIKGAEPRSAQLVIRLTPTERSRIAGMAAAAGITTTDLVLRALGIA